MTFRVGDAVDQASLVGERWYAAKDRAVVAATVEERFAIDGGALAIVRVQLAGGRTVRYTFPLADGSAPWIGLADLAAHGGKVRGETGGMLVGVPPPDPGQVPARAEAAAAAAVAVRPLPVDQSNTSMVIGEAVVLKLYRQVAPGPNPEVELAVALAGTGAVGAPIPAFAGAVRYLPPPVAAERERTPGNSAGRPIDVAVVQALVPAAVDEFEYRAEGVAAWLRAGAPSSGHAALLADVPDIGRSVAALHAALLGLRGRALRPRVAARMDAARWVARGARALDGAIRALAPIDTELAAELSRNRAAIDAALAPLAHAPANAVVARIHGDLNLGQLIRDGSGFLVVDLEGEPTRSVAERRRHDTPLRDIASMLRSFDHIARSGARRAGIGGLADARAVDALRPAIDAWLDSARAGFLEAYRDALRAHDVVVVLERRMLHALEVEKELYEFVYSATYLPAWRYAPAAGLRWLLSHGPMAA